MVTTRLSSILRISLTNTSATYIVFSILVFLVVNQKICVSPGITPGLFLLEHRKKVYIEL
ncbi:MAG: hypothetical protein DRH24_13865 [Deltaproteobacteria bacterium]|nr:MAG: hypothetical protein DRH24_13865 [Deltaproteobacteria bacterium]